MSLFNDGRVTTAEDLRAVESTILDIASTEGIELDKKLMVSAREIGARISEFLLQRGEDPVSSRDLSSVVVTDPLRDWHIAHTLAVIFRDAYSSQLNDRYKNKWKQYAERSADAEQRLFNIGVGLSSDPIPAAGMPVTGTTNGGVLPAREYTVQVCWTNALGRSGGLSEPAEARINAGQLLTVKAIGAPGTAAGWCIYAAEAGLPVMRQNVSPIVIGATWIMPVEGLKQGPAPDAECLPDKYVLRTRIFRG